MKPKATSTIIITMPSQRLLNAMDKYGTSNPDKTGATYIVSLLLYVPKANVINAITTKPPAAKDA